jgi:hypothetical protein
VLVRKQLQAARLDDHAVKNPRATSCSSSRARLREKLEWSKLGSATSISRNQRNNRL